MTTTRKRLATLLALTMLVSSLAEAPGSQASTTCSASVGASDNAASAALRPLDLPGYDPLSGRESAADARRATAGIPDAYPRTREEDRGSATQQMPCYPSRLLPNEFVAHAVHRADVFGVFWVGLDLLA